MDRVYLLLLRPSSKLRSPDYNFAFREAVAILPLISVEPELQGLFHRLWSNRKVEKNRLSLVGLSWPNKSLKIAPGFASAMSPLRRHAEIIPGCSKQARRGGGKKKSLNETPRLQRLFLWLK